MALIRLATDIDRDDIREIYMQAFPEGENETVAALAVDLLNEETRSSTLTFVAEVDDTVVGHVAFSPVILDNNNDWTGYILAPLAVKPEYQKRQLGSKLVETGQEQLIKSGVNVLLVYGDPGYYGRFGFNAETAVGYLPPYELEYPSGWLATNLSQGVVTGSVRSISCVDLLNDPQLW